MSARIQLVLEAQEKELFRREAEREGLSLSAWLRQAAHEKIEVRSRSRLRSPEDLRDFFAQCDQREVGREPEWNEHLTVMQESRGFSW